MLLLRQHDTMTRTALHTHNIAAIIARLFKYTGPICACLVIDKSSFHLCNATTSNPASPDMRSWIPVSLLELHYLNRCSKTFIIKLRTMNLFNLEISIKFCNPILMQWISKLKCLICTPYRYKHIKLFFCGQCTHISAFYHWILISTCAYIRHKHMCLYAG